MKRRRASARGEVAKAVAVLRAGGLVALPTETVYGLAADAENELAVRRIFAVKGRPATHPLIVHLAAQEPLERWAKNIPASARALAKAFWPGPLTLVLERTKRASDAVTGGQDTVALRVPGHPLAQRLLAAFAGGLAAPSANRFGKVSPTRAEHVRADLGEEVDLILDGGPCEVGVESTIVDLTGPEPVLLRPGGLSREALERVLGVPLGSAAKSTVRAPGLLAAHYAPRAGVVLVEPGELADQARERLASGARVAVLAPRGTRLPSAARLYPVAKDPRRFAHRLYSLLRQIDSDGYQVILVEVPTGAGLGLAVGDRLRRAAHSSRDR